MKRLRLGTRSSPLARAQASAVAAAIVRHDPDVHVETVFIATRGDRILDVPLAKIGGKGLFLKEIEDALLRREIDLAVHSLKDVPAALPAGLALCAHPAREDPSDAVVGRAAPTIDGLPAGARVGTSSLRRAVQLRALRADLEIVSVRGNVGTRLDRLDRGEVDAVVLAAAGLRRLGLLGRATEIVAVDRMLPAVGQGVLAIEVRADDDETARIARALHDAEAGLAVAAERAFLAGVGGSCQTPIGCHARRGGDGWKVDAFVASLDASRFVRGRRSLAASAGEADLRAAGRSMARELLDSGARAILAEIAAAS
jgi:hydroxymethylbilane synthase